MATSLCHRRLQHCFQPDDRRTELAELPSTDVLITESTYARCSSSEKDSETALYQRSLLSLKQRKRATSCFCPRTRSRNSVGTCTSAIFQKLDIPICRYSAVTDTTLPETTLELLPSVQKMVNNSATVYRRADKPFVQSDRSSARATSSDGTAECNKFWDAEWR